MDFYKKDQSAIKNAFQKQMKTKYSPIGGTASNKENYVNSRENFLADSHSKNFTYNRIK